MKTLAFVLATFTTLAAAGGGGHHHHPPPPPPPPPPHHCKPATYRCSTDPSSGGPAWEVCNTSGQWVFAGDCPPKTVCKFLQSNGSPYCVPPEFTLP